MWAISLSPAGLVYHSHVGVPNKLLNVNENYFVRENQYGGYDVKWKPSSNWSVEKGHKIQQTRVIIFLFKPLTATTPVFGGRRGGLVISALDFWSGGRWLDTGLCRRVDSSDKMFYSKLPVFQPRCI